MVLLAVLALAVASCLGESETDGAIPWIDTPPTTEPARPEAPPCREEQLRGTLFLQGATGSAVGYVTLRHRGSRPCSLRGTPTLLIDGAARSHDWRVLAMPVRGESEDLRWGRLNALRPGEEAGFQMHWSNWCGTSSPTVELDLPSGTVPVTPQADSMSGAGARCDAPQYPASIAVTRFLPPSDKSKPVPLRAELVGVPTGKEPAFELRRGEPLRYRLALTNVSRRSFRFRSCPTYEHGLVAPEQTERFVLNCRPMGTVSPGERAVFEMVFRVPDDAPLGRTGFSWSLVQGGADPPWAAVPVEVGA
jgi:hypothetical protein